MYGHWNLCSVAASRLLRTTKRLSRQKFRGCNRHEEKRKLQPHTYIERKRRNSQQQQQHKMHEINKTINVNTPLSQLIVAGEKTSVHRTIQLVMQTGPCDPVRNRNAEGNLPNSFKVVHR